jgi:alkanesulfonate monooxygenase SsuD/methylene tetrahydromethanopterin reductase-like flavin-dependent oxidoreductase (luciferase family)
LTADHGSQRDRVEMHNANALKIGLFGANCSSARTATLVPERWLANWPDCLKMARIADETGIDFILPIGRWKGYGGSSNFHGTTFETITWACGLLAATKRITIFGTVHAPLFHPLIAAKEMVTADHIGQGRFGLNIVAGWNEDEFEMFGVQRRDHQDRYEFAQEWIDVVKRAWSEQDEFDFDGKFFKLAGVHCLPGPYGGTRPVIMNAGASGTGQAFAMRNCDAFFTSTAALRLTVAGTAHDKNVSVFDRIVQQVNCIKSDAREFGREIEVFTQGQVICRPTQGEAEDYHHYANVENADWPAIEQMLALKNITPQNTSADEYKAKRLLHAVSGIGGFPFVGTPDEVAREFAEIGHAGVRGIAVSFVNYNEEVPYFCAEVLPRIKRMGLRAN